jgi:NAD(P)H-dependent FMN reductase
MSESSVNIAVILGSTRPNRHSEDVGRWLLDRATRRSDLTIEAIDLAQIDLPIYDEPHPPIMGAYTHQHTRDWAERIGPYDGYVFVTPEYNRSVPAVLKNAIDYLYAEWTNKAAGFVSYGADAGGARAVEHLRCILGELHIADVRTMVPLSLTDDFEQYTHFAPTEAAAAKADAMLAELTSWARAMRTVRHGGRTPRATRDLSADLRR